ncbi:hypothetical protein HK096_009605, partial [Nowakowskiella sp. JEL0078]
NSFADIDPALIAATCLYLACKVEEFQVHIKTVVENVNKVIDETKVPVSELYPFTPAKVAEMEYYLIEELDYCLILFHPLDDVIHLAILKLRSYVVNDMYRTDLPLLYSPKLLAIVGIFVACSLNQDIVSTNDAINFFSDYTVSSVEICLISQELFDIYQIWSDTTIPNARDIYMSMIQLFEGSEVQQVKTEQSKKRKMDSTSIIEPSDQLTMKRTRTNESPVLITSTFSSTPIIPVVSTPISIPTTTNLRPISKSTIQMRRMGISTTQQILSSPTLGQSPQELVQTALQQRHQFQNQSLQLHQQQQQQILAHPIQTMPTTTAAQSAISIFQQQQRNLQQMGQHLTPKQIAEANAQQLSLQQKMMQLQMLQRAQMSQNQLMIRQQTQFSNLQKQQQLQQQMLQQHQQQLQQQLQHNQQQPGQQQYRQ